MFFLGIVCAVRPFEVCCKWRYNIAYISPISFSVLISSLLVKLEQAGEWYRISEGGKLEGCCLLMILWVSECGEQLQRLIDVTVRNG